MKDRTFGRALRNRWPAAAAALVMLLSGCGDDGDGESERRTTADLPAGPSVTTGATAAPLDTAEGPAAAYVSWVDALARMDAATACGLQAPELTIDLRYDAVLVDRAQLGDPCTGFEALLWEDPGFDPEVVDVEVTQRTPEDAVLAVRLATRSLTVRMVYHRARWRVLSTEDRTDRGPDGGSGPARWVAAWCALSPDQTRAEIVAAMGEPSGEYTVADGGEPQLWWARDQYDFRAYLDVDGSVLELVGDYDGLDAEDRALLPCPELRS